jgi:hypothetical protein
MNVLEGLPFRQCGSQFLFVLTSIPNPDGAFGMEVKTPNNVAHLPRRERRGYAKPKGGGKNFVRIAGHGVYAQQGAEPRAGSPGIGIDTN